MGISEGFSGCPHTCCHLAMMSAPRLCKALVPGVGPFVSALDFPIHHLAGFSTSGLVSLYPPSCSQFSLSKRYTWAGGCYCCSAAPQSCPTLCNPVDCSTPGFPVPHHLPKFAQVHVHCIGDTIQPSHPLTPPSLPAFNLSQHQGLFQ